MKSFIKLDLPPNQHKSKSLDKGIDVFAPKYRQGSERYLLQGLERWKKEHPERCQYGYEDNEHHWETTGCSLEDTF